METESVASPPNDLLRFLPTLLTFAVLGGAAIVAMGGLKLHHSAPAASAPAAAVEASPTAMPAAATVQAKQVRAEIVYLVDSPKVQAALETSPTLKRGASEISFDVMLVQTPEQELQAQETLASVASELTAIGIDLEVIDLRDPAAKVP